MLQIALILTERRFSSPARGKRSSNSRCGQIGWKPKTPDAMCFRRRLRSHIFQQIEVLKRDFSYYRYHPDTYQSQYVESSAGSVSQFGSAPHPTHEICERNRLRHFPIWPLSPKTFDRWPKRWNTWWIRLAVWASHLTYRILRTSKIAFCPPRKTGNLRDAAEGLRTERILPRSYLPSGKKHLTAWRIGAMYGRKSAALIREYQSLVSRT